MEKKPNCISDLKVNQNNLCYSKQKTEKTSSTLVSKNTINGHLHWRWKCESKWQYIKYIHVLFNPRYSQESILKNTLNVTLPKIVFKKSDTEWCKNR